LDLRRDVTCAFYEVNTSFQEELCTGGISNIAQGKFSRYFLENGPGASTAKGTGINWPMLRYSDVLLMHAEAENELNGPTAAAQESLKRVRRRAFDSGLWDTKVDNYVAAVSSNKDAFFEAIVDERAWEFGGEMIRKYELIRWGIYSEKMAETVQTLKDMADSAFNGTGEYAHLPDYLYWKRDASGRFTVLNANRKITAAPDETWQRAPWLLDLHSDQTTYKEWITKDWRNYIDQGPKPGVARYVFPIPQEAITNSQGVLKNDGYSFQ
jgi:hypothetical protein